MCPRISHTCSADTRDDDDGVDKRARPTDIPRRGTEPMDDDSSSDEEAAEQQEQQEQPPTPAPLHSANGSGGAGPSYFDDQGGRVIRGSSFSTSLDVRVVVCVLF